MTYSKLHSSPATELELEPRYFSSCLVIFPLGAWPCIRDKNAGRLFLFCHSLGSQLPGITTNKQADKQKQKNVHKKPRILYFLSVSDTVAHLQGNLSWWFRILSDDTGDQCNKPVTLARPWQVPCYGTGKRVRSVGSGARLPGCKPQHCHLPAVELWARHLQFCPSASTKNRRNQSTYLPGLVRTEQG